MLTPSQILHAVAVWCLHQSEAFQAELDGREEVVLGINAAANKMVGRAHYAARVISEQLASLFADWETLKIGCSDRMRRLNHARYFILCSSC